MCDASEHYICSIFIGGISRIICRRFGTLCSIVVGDVSSIMCDASEHYICSIFIVGVSRIICRRFGTHFPLRRWCEQDYVRRFGTLYLFHLHRGCKQDYMSTFRNTLFHLRRWCINIRNCDLIKREFVKHKKILNEFWGLLTPNTSSGHSQKWNFLFQVACISDIQYLC
jgi:hypothetical protein